MNQIKVYTKKRCPYCTSAKIWLSQRNYAFEEISLDDTEVLREFTEKNPSLRTVPQIFLGLENIGGFSELIKSKLA
jgi:glutaredoxin